MVKDNTHIRVGLVGYGYWGPNLARNFAREGHFHLAMICDCDSARRRLAEEHYPGTKVVADAEELFGREDLDLVLIATPVQSHYALAKAALSSGKHVLVEKPMAANSAQARELVALAEQQGRMLAVDHTFLYTGAIRKIHEILLSGELGEILYMDSVRINLGLIQPDVDVIWDLGAHDFSILAHLIPSMPGSIRAMGNHHQETQKATSAYVHFEYADGFMAHCHLNWLAPVKIRRMLIGGTRKMLVYDDMDPTEKIKIYDKGVLVETVWDRATADQLKVDYRTGDIWAPKLDHREALLVQAEHLAECIKNRSTPISDGAMGLCVVELLEAAEQAMCSRDTVVLAAT